MRRLSMLLYALSMSMHLEPEVECTMEANPEVSRRPWYGILGARVNRLSIGVQSFDDEVLRISDVPRRRSCQGGGARDPGALR